MSSDIFLAKGPKMPKLFIWVLSASVKTSPGDPQLTKETRKVYDHPAFHEYPAQAAHRKETLNDLLELNRFYEMITTKFGKFWLFKVFPKLSFWWHWSFERQW